MKYFLEQKQSLLGKLTYYLLDGYGRLLYTLKISPDRKSARLLDNASQALGAVRLVGQDTFNKDSFADIALYNQPITPLRLDRAVRIYILEQPVWYVVKTNSAMYIDQLSHRDSFLEQKGPSFQRVELSVEREDDLLREVLLWAAFQLDHEEIVYASSSERKVPLPDLPKTAVHPQQALKDGQEKEAEIWKFLKEQEALYRSLKVDVRVSRIDVRKQAAFEKELDRVWKDLNTQLEKAVKALHADPYLLREKYQLSCTELSGQYFEKAKETSADLMEAQSVLLTLIEQEEQKRKTSFDLEMDAMLDDLKKYYS